MSVWPTMTVHWTKLVCPRSVLIHALEQFVAPELSAKWSSTQQFATVLLVSKAMSMLPVLRSNVPPMMIVPPMRNVTILEADRERSACHSVSSQDVPQEPSVLLAITRSSVNAAHLWREMAMPHVQSVSLMIVNLVYFDRMRFRTVLLIPVCFV